MCVFSSRHYLAESLAADREQGHVPDYALSVAHLDHGQQFARKLSHGGGAIDRSRAETERIADPIKKTWP